MKRVGIADCCATLECLVRHVGAASSKGQRRWAGKLCWVNCREKGDVGPHDGAFFAGRFWCSVSLVLLLLFVVVVVAAVDSTTERL